METKETPLNIHISSKEKEKDDVKEENSKNISLTIFPSEIIINIANFLIISERFKLSRTSTSYNAFIKEIPLNLFTCSPVFLINFNEHFGKKKNYIISELNVASIDKNDSLISLLPYSKEITKFRLEYQLLIGGETRLELAPGIDIDTLPSINGIDFFKEKVYIDLITNFINLREITLWLNYRLANLSALGNCLLLERICLNQFNGNSPCEEIGKCKNLIEIKIDGIVKPSNILRIFNKLELLKKLFILEGVDLFILPDLSGCVSLNEIVLQQCKVLRDISSISKCQNLTDFTLLQSLVRDFTPLASCKKLKKIALLESEEDLEIDTNIFSELSELEILKIAGMRFTDNSSFEYFCSLKELSLSNIINKSIPSLPLIDRHKNKGLKFLFLMQMNIRNLDELKNSSNLENCYIENMPELRSINFLSFCPNLTSLSITQTPLLRDMSFLSGHDLLSKLDIQSENITNLTFLERYPKLTEMKIQDARLKTTKGIEFCPLLSFVIFLSCEVLVNLAGFDKLSKLEKIGLQNCPINSIPKLACNNLTEIGFSCSLVNNLDFLENCKNLDTLFIFQAEGLKDIRTLEKLKRLVKISLIDCSNITNLEDLSGCFSLRLFEMHGYKDYRKRKVNNFLSPLLKCKYLEGVDIKDSIGIKFEDIEVFNKGVKDLNFFNRFIGIDGKEIRAYFG